MVGVRRDRGEKIYETILTVFHDSLPSTQPGKKIAYHAVKINGKIMDSVKKELSSANREFIDLYTLFYIFEKLGKLCLI